jgi:Tfp pilus assembly protein PilN
MRAINLLPKEARRGGMAPSLNQLGPSHLLIGLLAIALAVVTFAVLEGNTISSRKAQLASLKQQEVALQSQITRLNTYTQFEKLAQSRDATVRQLAATRFDWHAALSDLSKVVPANTSLQSLVATVAPGTSISGSTTGSSAGGNVRGDLAAPAFELRGCTASHDDVARLMSRLRLINNVSRVTLEDSTKQSAGQSGTSVSGSSASGCRAGGPTFDMVVFFQPLSSGAGTVGATTGATRSH